MGPLYYREDQDFRRKRMIAGLHITPDARQENRLP
jgi:hypothetical protein